MGALIQAKQIEKFIQAPVYVSGFWFPTTATASVTAAITTALATAGAGGTMVPLQVATAGKMGLIVTGNNLANVYDNATGRRISDSKGNEVYGRLTAGYSLSLYSKVEGVETAYVPPSIINIDFTVNYKFNFDSFPEDAIAGVGTRYIADDPNTLGDVRITPLVLNSNYTAYSGDFIFVDASAAPVAVTLPIAPHIGSTVRIITDKAGINNVTLKGNVAGHSGDPVISYDGDWTLRFNGTEWNVIGGYILLPETIALRKKLIEKPDDDRIVLINGAISKMKDLGIWSKIGWMSFLAAHHEQAARINWVNPSQELTYFGPQWIRDYGFKFDGLSTYLTTGIAINALANFSRDDAAMGVFVPDNTGGATGIEFGTSNSYIAALQTSSVVARGNHSTSGQTLPLGTATAVGFSYWSRKDAAKYSIGRNLLAPVEKTVASTALDGSIITVGRAGSSASGFSSKPISLVVAGRLSVAEMQSLYSAVVAPYLTALGITVP